MWGSPCPKCPRYCEILFGKDRNPYQPRICTPLRCEAQKICTPPRCEGGTGYATDLYTLDESYVDCWTCSQIWWKLFVRRDLAHKTFVPSLGHVTVSKGERKSLSACGDAQIWCEISVAIERIGMVSRSPERSIAILAGVQSGFFIKLLDREKLELKVTQCFITSRYET